MAGVVSGASLCKLLLLILLAIFVKVEARCEGGDGGVVRRAFSSVHGFTDGLYSTVVGDGACEVREIKLPGKNLTGAVSWMVLANLSSLEAVDLSMNMLQGSVPPRFWSMPSLKYVNIAGNRIGGMVRFETGFNSSSLSLSKLNLLNLSGNRFTNSIHFAGFANLQTLDLSGNNLRYLPFGLDNITELKHLDLSGCNISGAASNLSKMKSLVYLDVSRNAMNGSFPSDFPSLNSIKFLNISMNNFTISPEKAANFSPSAFIGAGIAVFLKSPPPPIKHLPPDLNRQRHATSGRNSSQSKTYNNVKPNHHRRRHKALIIGSALAATTVAAMAILFLCLFSRRRRLRKERKWAITKPQPQFPSVRPAKYAGPFSFETESGTWVAEIKDPTSSPVIMFEKPLMRLTFSDLLAATSGFGRDSQLSDTRRGGPVYRAILPGDIHVAIKVLDRARNISADAAAALFEDLADVRHPNLLPIAGYCIAGKEKLVLSEYMVNGDLHRWLHELPAGHPNVEDWSTDTWENPSGMAAERSIGWTMRHKIALGTARGLAFLHHAGARPLIHGHVVATNVLLDEGFEPRLADFGLSAEAGETSAPSDVYDFGVVLLELLTVRQGSPEMVAGVRKLVKEKKYEEVLDRRLEEAADDESVAEMAEALRVGYRCTAEPPEKRPTMQQVVGMLKDVHSNIVHTRR